jgi:G6PDH family F420-dependent oxidoreductase
MSDVRLGFTLSSEEHGPGALVEHARLAEEAGFDFLSISDHFHPWVSAQGEAPFVWSTLGGVATATDDIGVGVGVTCPTMRIHPVNVAHATATVADMLDDRFFFGVGTGERLNEHVTAEQWPEHAVRLRMLEEAVEVIRDLWAGGQTSHHGEFYDVQNARLFTLPDETPPIVVSAFGDRAAAAAAEFGDGFWSVGPQDVVETWEERGGEGPRYTQLHACVADSEDEAVRTAHEQWPNSGLPGELAAELPTPAHFEQACQMVEEEDIRESAILTTPDPDAHIESIEQSIEQGYDHVYMHQIGGDQEAAIEFYRDEVFPSFR